jgi:succinate-semialdehyde dehydrogenase/glutarate-semialdehyde dehydrogenase
MAIESVNPTTGERLASFAPLDERALEAALVEAAKAAVGWRETPFAERARCLRNAASLLRRESERYARLVTLEMGKLIQEARAEIEKCAWGCEYYAEHAERFLAEETVATDAALSYVAYEPLGTLLAIMPWNFPFWQVFRAAAPALMAGNTVLLKHASNVPQCALAIEELFRTAGLPPGVFRTLLIDAAQAERLIADPRIRAVTLTGSEAAGRRVAELAGRALKKTVLELGGSDAFVVFEDADLEKAAAVAVASRFLNAGQSCIAAKRFILVEGIADEFIALFRDKATRLVPGDPLDESTTLAPLARADLRETLHRQVRDSIAAGARLVFGGEPLPGPGFFYAPTMLDAVAPGMRAYAEELFGPVAIVIRAKDELEALRLANDSRYGLGASVWTRDRARGERFARRLEAGSCFVNGLVKSDPRLPFGGVKCSGYGRELSYHGIREFVNIKTVWVG